MMDNLLQGIPGICVNIDDILITSSNDEEHLEHLDEVLRTLAETGMMFKPAKYAYLLPLGLHTSDAKVSGIVEAPAPRNVAELTSFLGLVNYYSKFLPDLATTLSPLYALLQNTKPWS